MVVKIEIPCEKGHEQQKMELEKAKSFVDNKIQKGWIATINGKQTNAKSITESDTVRLFPAVHGG